MSLTPEYGIRWLRCLFELINSYFSHFTLLSFLCSAGLLRNIGHKKRECTRQPPTLVYTGGALTWHVSLLFRRKKPLPYSEEHDSHIDCILGIAPDMIVFMDYYTKVGGEGRERRKVGFKNNE